MLVLLSDDCVHLAHSRPIKTLHANLLMRFSSLALSLLPVDRNIAMDFYCDEKNDEKIFGQSELAGVMKYKRADPIGLFGGDW